MILRLLCILFICYGLASSENECTHRLYEAKGNPKPGSNGFSIEISAQSEGESLNPTGYVPGKSYKISLRGWQTAYTVQTFRGFGIVAQFQDGRPAGKFDVPKRKRDRGDARIAPNCRSAGISHANLRPKTSAHVIWRAPEAGDACVIFRASVIQSRTIWYANENELTKEFCAVEGYQKNIPVDDPNAECCACDEAKYDVEFIGIWSKETHPKDFPTLEHLTHFTDILGASHSKKYTMWKMGEVSSDGMKEIAEWGNTYKGEHEMKANASEIRTIIKMKGLWYPEVQGRTSGTFTVNKYHNLASLGAMFGPSPDWCVGVSQINLCLPDCTWAEERVFDLQPFDAGTDNGETYMSPNNPAEPRIPIAPITTKTDKLSPFYSETSDEIPPLARLIIKRSQVISSTCKTDNEYQKEAFNTTNISEEEEYKDRRECSVSNWESWSLCSATCGKGIRIRSRVYIFPVKAQMFNCHRQTTERQFCNAKINECADSDAFNSKCAVTNWQAWSDCSVSCGKGTRKRERSFKDKEEASTCTAVEIVAHEPCIGDSGEDCSVTPNPLCRTTTWSEWSPCSASCDDGVRIRTRLFFYAEHEDQCTNINLMEKEKCQMSSCRRLLGSHSEEICQEEKEEGQCKGTFPRYWYNKELNRCERFIYTGCKGNRNQFETEEECKSLCVPDFVTNNKAILPGHQLVNEFTDDGPVDDGGDAINCVVSEWTPWGNCSVSCGRGKRQRNRVINIFARNGGTPCPPSEHLIQERHCTERPCAPKSCRVGPWSTWSRCSVPCGEGVQHRRRVVLRSQNIEEDLDDPACSAPDKEKRVCRMPCNSEIRV
uniref:Spondin-1 n=1 Tax=Panagrolaimus sp. ES5 TaxID=591445 RepID=A0AC34FN29_9BILA